nr:TetR/AcrR family transcriptional regulator [Nocardia bovistercoris]
MRDAREQLFDAAERILLRDGPNALTSRSVTGEAGCAKGVLHRHFEDFDAFLVELVLDRIRGIEDRSATLCAAAGTGTVVGNVTEVLTEVFESVAGAILPLITFRDELRTRLRAAGLRGLPVVTESAAMIAAYLTRERALGRIDAAADIEALAPTVIGVGHLLYADRSAAPHSDQVRRMVSSVLAGALS